MLLNFIKKEIVLIISWVLAIITMFFNPPNLKYINYIDFYTLILLFSLMCIICGLENNNLFYKIINFMLKKIKTTKQLDLIIIFVTFFSSMLITNDVALIVFVPFTIKILSILGLKNKIINLVILQTIAANLGSMATPIGNPQNLYLYSNYRMGFLNFILNIFPFVLLSFLILLAFVCFKKSYNIVIPKENLSNKKTKTYLNYIYLFLFIFCILTIARFINMYVLFALVFFFVLIFDKNVLKHIDYSLLLTFIGFFIFVGNVENMSIISNFIKNIMVFDNVLISILLSQFISNVPASILLSKFTNDSYALLIGTNLGGLGTLIASMASLISYKYVIKHNISYKNKYIFKFSIYNIIFLILLVLLYFLL